MKLQDTERQIMASLEYERACSCLKQAEGNASMDFWDVVANRLYYAVFHTVSTKNPYWCLIVNKKGRR